MSKIRVGVAGIGFIGPVHIEALRRIPGVEVVSICHHSDKVSAKAEALAIDHFYQSYDSFLKKDRLDTVHICTPNFLHFEMVQKALMAGKHVLCEKPLTTTSAEATSLLQLATQRKLIHAIHFNIRYYPLVREMKARCQNGSLGDIYAILGSYLQDWLFYDTDYNWRLESEQSGTSRAIADIGSHLMDLLEYITGLQITEVMADFNTVHPVRKKPLQSIDTYSGKSKPSSATVEVPIHTEDHATVLLRFNNGSKGSVTVSQVAAGRKNRLQLELSGSNESYSWVSEKPNELWIGLRDSANQLLIRDPALMQPSASDIASIPGGHNEGFQDTSKALFTEVYQSIQTGVPPSTPSYPTFADGLREIILCERIIESHKHQTWITV